LDGGRGAPAGPAAPSCRTAHGLSRRSRVLFASGRPIVRRAAPATAAPGEWDLGFVLGGGFAVIIRSELELPNSNQRPLPTSPPSTAAFNYLPLSLCFRPRIPFARAYHRPCILLAVQDFGRAYFWPRIFPAERPSGRALCFRPRIVLSAAHAFGRACYRPCVLLAVQAFFGRAYFWPRILSAASITGRAHFRPRILLAAHAFLVLSLLQTSAWLAVVVLLFAAVGIVLVAGGLGVLVHWCMVVGCYSPRGGAS